MIRLSLSAIALAAAALMVGCASPVGVDTTEESTDSTESAASTNCDLGTDGQILCDGPGPSPNVYTIAFSDGSISGVNSRGATLSGAFATTTTYRLANLSKFIPTEPHYPAALAYNNAVLSQGDVVGAVSSFASIASAHARFSVKSGSVFAFRPVP